VVIISEISGHDIFLQGTTRLPDISDIPRYYFQALMGHEVKCDGACNHGREPMLVVSKVRPNEYRSSSNLIRWSDGDAQSS